MRRLDLLSFGFLFLVSVGFFYQFFLFDRIPFPGDLLVNLNPYVSESFLGYAPGGYTEKFQGADVVHQMYPWKYFSIESLKKGTIPFWTPHNFSGNLLMQNFQSGVFSPFNFLFFLFSFLTAWSLFIFVQPLLASFFMYVFLRDLRLARTASLVGSIAFAFSSYMVVWIEYGNIDYAFLWLPLILFLSSRYFDTQKRKFFLFLLLAFVCMFLAGYIQGVFYIYMLSFAYILYKRIAGLMLIQHETADVKTIFPRKFVFDLSALFILPVCLTAFQWLPTLVFFVESTRGNYSLGQIQQLLQPVYYLVTIFVPDYFGNPAVGSFWPALTYIERVMYMGVPVLFFALYAVFYIKSGIKTFFVFVAGLVLLLTTNLPGVAFFYLIPIPVLSTTVPTRMLSLFIFSMIVVSCFGINYWIVQKKAWKSFYPLMFLCVYLLIGLTTVLLGKTIPSFFPHVSIALRSLLFSSLFACFCAGLFYLRRFSRTFLPFLLIALTIVDLFYFFTKITPFTPRLLVYPKTPIITYMQNHAGINRYWGYGAAYIPPNFQAVDGTYSPEGDDPLHLKWYGEFLSTTGTGRLPNLLPRPDANIAAGYGKVDLRNNHYRQRAMDILGVKYVIGQRVSVGPDYDTFPQAIYTLVWQDSHWQVYENREVLPRYFLTSSYVVGLSKNDIVKKIYAFSGKTVVLEKTPSLTISPDVRGVVSLVYYKNQEVKFQTKSSGNMLLFLSDTYHPYWKVTIDGKTAELYRANYAFRGVIVPGGIHTVLMTFVPWNFYEGLWIGLAAVILCLVYIFCCWKR